MLKLGNPGKIFAKRKHLIPLVLKDVIVRKGKAAAIDYAKKLAFTTLPAMVLAGIQNENKKQKTEDFFQAVKDAVDPGKKPVAL